MVNACVKMNLERHGGCFKMSKTYYHLTSWQIGPELFDQQCGTNWEVSHYWQYKLGDSSLVNYEREFREIPEGQQVSEEIMCLLVHGKYSAELLKEYIFEELRASEFSHLPSRKRCMFLLNAGQVEDADAELQKMGFKGSALSGKSLIRVEPIGDNPVTHQTDWKLLNVNQGKFQEIAANAWKYWQGTSQPVKSEVLFEGQFIIREVIKRY